jgi:hypothetical protein
MFQAPDAGGSTSRRQKERGRGGEGEKGRREMP